jgi:hypothetical protein
MPTKTKSRNNSRNNKNNSRSNRTSNVAEEKPVVVTTDDDWCAGLIQLTKPSSRKSTPTNKGTPRPEFLEPLSPVSPLMPVPPPPTPWENLGMTEQDFHEMMARVNKQYEEDRRREYKEHVLAEMNSPSYWERRIEILEKEREFFNKKRGWSAGDIVCVDRIDAQIAECEGEVERIYAELDRLENEYD